MALKGIEKITDVLNEFLKPFDLVAVFDIEFAYYYNLNEIHYTIVFDSHMENLYNEFVRELRPELNYNNWFILSLLHEIGHHETTDEISNCKHVYCKMQKLAIEKLGMINEDFAHKRYFRLLDEKMATEWGLDYLANHFDEMNTLWNKVYAAIIQFYKLNNVKGD